MESWRKSVFSPDDSKCPAGLKYHFASIYLDEVDNAGKSLRNKAISTDITPEQVSVFLEPYVQLLGEKSLS